MRDASDHQRVGLAAMLSIVVGSIIGAGIFVLPVSLAPLGWNAALGWLVSGLGALSLAFALANLTRGGEGIQTHVERAFGPLPAFIAAWAFWFGAWTTNAVLALAAVAMLSRIDPSIDETAVITPLAAGFVVALTAVNALGIRAAGSVQMLTTAIKLLPLIAVTAILLLRIARGGELQPLAPTPISFDHIATAAALTLFALTGFENATTPVNKVRNASRTLPVAIVTGTAFVALLYLLSSTAVPLLLSPGTAVASSAPFADVFASQWGEGAVLIAAFCMAVSAFGCLNAGILAAGELGYAMASRGDLPRLFARTRQDCTPVYSQCLAGALGVGLILLNAGRDTASLFTFIILVSTLGTLVMYAIGALAALQAAGTTKARTVIILAILFAMFAFYGAGLEANAWGLFLVAVGLVVRGLTRSLNARHAKPPVTEQV